MNAMGQVNNSFDNMLNTFGFEGEPSASIGELPHQDLIVSYESLNRIISDYQQQGYGDNDEISLSGYRIRLIALKEMLATNQKILNSNLKKNSRSVLQDGYITREEALATDKKVKSDCFWWLIPPDLYEHWNARYVLNQHK